MTSHRDVKVTYLPKITIRGLRYADATLTINTYSHVLHTLQSDTAMQFEQLLKRKKPLNRAVRKKNPDFHTKCAMNVQWDFLKG